MRCRGRGSIVINSTGSATLAAICSVLGSRLHTAIANLSGQQRVAVLLVHGYGYSFREAADVLGVSLGTLRTHLGRGLERLRHELEVSNGVSS
jgi:RNA polymerase sigma factor (sigma-70 family)